MHFPFFCFIITGKTVNVRTNNLLFNLIEDYAHPREKLIETKRETVDGALNKWPWKKLVHTS